MQRQDATADGAPPVRGRTVLVTGGAGFVGSHIADALVGYNDVRVLDDLSNGRRDNVPDGATLVEGDVRDEAALGEAASGVDLVFHQAGLVSVPASVEDPMASQSRNVAGTLAVLDRARREDARVVLASSVAIYGDPVELPVDEDHPTNPTSPYGVDKLAVDHHARLAHEHYGVETVALRYFNVYGPRQSGGEYSGVVDAFLEQATAGQPLTVHGDGTQTRDFVHVSDVVRANLAAARTDAVGTAFNVGTGRSVSVRTLAETVRDVADSTSDVVHVDARPGDVDRSRADVSRARRLLDFEPRVALEDGLRGLLEAPRANR
jgi:UDP-glucose 4-epimerase